MGELLYGFAMDFRTAAITYNQICSGKIPESLEAHLLIAALNLNHYPMLDLHMRLTDGKEKGANSTQIMGLVANFPNLSALTQMENQLHGPRQASSSTFHVEQDSCSDDENISTRSQSETVDMRYDSASVLRSYKIEKRANHFPTHLGVDDPVNMPDTPRSKNNYRTDFGRRDRVVRQQLLSKIGAKCSRCFRAHCPRREQGGKFAFGTTGTALYIPNASSHVLKSILMWLAMDKHTCEKVVKAFYTSRGNNFVSL
jgi:hypothetical protein